MLSLVVVAAASLGTLTPKEIVEDSQFMQSCPLSPYQALPNCDMSWPPFWTASLVPMTEGCNCGRTPKQITYTAGTGAEAGFAVERTVCGVKVTADFKMKVEASMSIQTDVPPCKCMSYVFW